MNQLLKEFDRIYERKIQHYEDSKDIIRGFYNNEFSCVNGCISDLIYYYQTLDIFKKYPIELMEYLSEFDYEIKINPIHRVESEINHLIWLAFETYVYNRISLLEVN